MDDKIRKRPAASIYCVKDGEGGEATRLGPILGIYPEMANCGAVLLAGWESRG